MKNRIYIKQWLGLKPYKRQTPTDLYYLKISNRIKEVLYSKSNSKLFTYLEREADLDVISCFLSSYFEDVISKTNIWFAFISFHQKQYGKKLPFFETNEYFEGEVNQQDVSFLLWYFLNKVQDNTFVSPYDDFIEDLAIKVMEILEEEFEYAPENEVLKNYYSLDADSNDFYTVRNLIDLLLLDTYLFYPDTSAELDVLEREIIEGKKQKALIPILQDNRDVFLHKIRTSLMALPGKEWVAAVLGEDHALSTDIKDISPRIPGYFFYKGQDSRDIFLEHIASGKSFKLTKKSFDHASELVEIDCILYMGIVRWQNEWWFSGVNMKISFNENLVMRERNSDQSKMKVGFLDDRDKEKRDLLHAHMEAFLSFNNGSLIAFMPVKDFQKFSEDFIDYYNKTVKLDTNLIEDATKTREEKLSDYEEENDDKYTDIEEFGLIFFNLNSGLEMAWGVNSAFPLPHNPYFDQNESDDNTLGLMTSKDISTELAMYRIAECGSKLTFFTEKPGKDYLRDIDFLLRFWKKDWYHTQPAVTLV